MAIRKSPEEKDAERRAKLCKCSASCSIPAVELTKLTEHGTTAHYCACPDYQHRGGSYPDGQCKHVHSMRVQAFVAPQGSPLAVFQSKNPLGTIDECEALITKLCGPDPKKQTASMGSYEQQNGRAQRTEPVTIQPEVQAILNKPLPPRRALRIIR